jgi:site-specific DNA-methyltransferase (adenine-specific)
MTTATLHLGDCLDVLPTLAADVAVIDPPYGIGKNNIVPGSRTSRNSKAMRTEYGVLDWDDERSPERVALALAQTKDAVVFGGNYYADILPVSRGWIVWDKQTSGNFSDFELAWTSYDRASEMFRYMWNGMLKAKPETRVHPTQKPLALMEWVIENYTRPGDTVLDCFMGSGTTGVACARLGRNFIGIERDPGYFAIAQRRIEQAQAQLALPLFSAEGAAL